MESLSSEKLEKKEAYFCARTLAVNISEVDVLFYFEKKIFILHCSIKEDKLKQARHSI